MLSLSLSVRACVLFKRFPLGMPELSHSFVAFSLGAVSEVNLEVCSQWVALQNATL